MITLNTNTVMTVVTRRMDDEGEVDEDSGSLMKVKLMKVKLMKTVDHCGRIRPRPRTGRLDRVERGEGGACVLLYLLLLTPRDATLSTLSSCKPGSYFILCFFTATIGGAKLCYI